VECSGGDVSGAIVFGPSAVFCAEPFFIAFDPPEFNGKDTP